jgi:mRNA interferase MazF
MGGCRGLGRAVRRGEVWLAELGRKPRPVVVLTRDEVIDVRQLVTVVEVTTQIRGSFVEVPIDCARIGLARESVVNADGLHTIAHTRLTRRLGDLTPAEARRVCAAVRVAIGC